MKRCFLGTCLFWNLSSPAKAKTAGLPFENASGKFLLKRNGRNVSLQRYFLEHGSLEFITDVQVKSLCTALGLKPESFKEGKVGLKSRLSFGT